MRATSLLTRLVLLASVCSGSAGCVTLAGSHTFIKEPQVARVDSSVPGELHKVTLPPYVIEPPDILLVSVLMPPTTEDLVAGTTLDATGKSVTRPANPFSKSFGPQPIDGQFLVGLDGTIMIGIYGSVQVAGLTRDQARERVRSFIAQVTEKKPESLQVVVDVLAYNSKVYYVILDGAGNGAQLQTFPIVGSETVLDALAKVNGLPPVSSKRHIWIARRSPNGGPEQILPLDWDGTVMTGAACTNYQILPGDRIYVHSQPFISLDNLLAKVFAPVERVFGITLLGTSTINQIRGRGQGFNNN